MEQNIEKKNRIDVILRRLNKEEFPEIYAYLKNASDSDTPYDTATTLLGLDLPKKLPEYLVSFITDMLLMEIQEDNDDAMNTLGSLYYEGSRGLEQSFEDAVYYYNMAAEKGNCYAQENLGYCYYYGRVGEPDYEKAFHYFALGAFAGQLISLYKIGDMYRQGLYVKKNEAEAFRIYMRCLQTMTEEAEGRIAGPVFLRLARMLLEGNGVKQDIRTALRFFQRAEDYLLDMVMNGDEMYRKSLEDAIEGQQRAREMIVLPEGRWEFDDR